MKEKTKSAKKPYTPPRLVTHGNLKTITKGGEALEGTEAPVQEPRHN